MSNLLSSISMVLENGWKFFTQTDVPGTNLSFATLTVGLALIPVCFRFLSIMLGHNIGEADFSTFDRFSGSGYGSAGSSRYRISDGRKNDVR